MRVEGEHGVGVVDNRPVAEVHAVEGPDGDPPPAVGTRLDLAQRYDPHDASTTYGFSWPSSVERAMARSRSLRVILTASPPAAPAAIALPFTTYSASLASTGRSGRKDSASSSGIVRSGSASSSLKGPIAVRSSSSQYASP